MTRGTSLSRTLARRSVAGAAGRFVFAVALLTVLAATSLRAEDDFTAGLAAYDAGDFAAAFAAWRPLAEAGDADAQVSLAALYLNGLGVAADPAAALAWYRRAAEAGDPVAQLNLGDLTARGIGVAKNPLEGLVWLSLAARQGKRWAAERRDEIAAELTPAERAEAEARVARFLKSE